jgi:hypothetical protein
MPRTDNAGSEKVHSHSPLAASGRLVKIAQRRPLELRPRVATIASSGWYGVVCSLPWLVCMGCEEVVGRYRL